MSSVKVSLACRNYDGTNALIRGLVKAAGIDLQVFECKDVVEMFSAMFRGQYDVAEMSLAELVYYLSRKKCDFIGLPIFPSRIFRHSFIYCNARAGIACPEDLSGKRIGFLRWVQTAHIWVRGLLVDEYNVSPNETRWYVASLHHWSDGDVEEEIEPRNGAVINQLKSYGKDQYESLCEALLQGELDAVVTTENHRYSVLAQQKERVKRLFENPKEAEISYYKNRKIFPIMHVLAVRNEAIKKVPDLPIKLFELFSESKRFGQRWVEAVPSMSLVWKGNYLEEEKSVFDGDPWSYGLKNNARVLEKFLDYCYAEGVSATRMRPQELFDPSTWNLDEEKPSGV